MKARIVVCASGEGSGFEAIVNAARAGQLSAEVVGLIANRPKIGAIGRAKRLDIPYKILAPKDHATRTKWDQAMAKQMAAWKADWVVLAGFLALIGPEVLRAHPKRIVNSHPALLPKHGGEGMYGERVHAAVLAAKERESGVTIHLVDRDYDRGQIVGQESFTFDPAHETIDSLIQRTKALEHRLYPRILEELLTGRIATS